MKRLLLTIAIGMLPVHAAFAGIISAMEYADDAAFRTATGAESLTGPLPDLPGLGAAGTSVTLGDATLSAGNTIFVGSGWSTLIPGGNAIAISGPENLDISINTGNATAFGGYVHEPTADTGELLDSCNATCIDSTFETSFYRAGAFIDSITWTPGNWGGGTGFGFGGVVLDEIFDEVRISEIVGGIDNEFFGEMYVTRAVSEPGMLGLLGAGLLGLAVFRRKRRS